MRGIPLGLVPLILLACGEPSYRDDARREPLPTSALAGIPVPATARATGVNGTGGSIEVALTESFSVDSLAAFYRHALIAEGWDLRVDGPLPGGGVSLHAVKDNRPVWVMIYPDPAGSRFNVITGVRDTSARPQ